MQETLSEVMSSTLSFLQPAIHVFQESMPGSYLALVVFLAVSSQWVAWKLRIPSILVLLVVGFALGQKLNAREIIGTDLLFAGVSMTVAIILFEGSLTLKFTDIRELRNSVRRLSTLTVIIAWPLITLAGLWVGLSWRLALLMGALLVVTGPTVINPILRQLRPTRRVSSLLRWEGIVVDPIGAVLASLVFQVIIMDPTAPYQTILFGLLYTVLIGLGIGIAAGWVLAAMLRRHMIPDFLQGVVFLSASLATYAVSNMLQHESGLLTVTVLGIFLTNQKGLKLSGVREFKEHLQVLFVGGLFILLAGLVSWAELVDVAPTAFWFILLLVVVVRPASVFLSLLGSDSSHQERTLLAFMAPRGIVAAAVTAIFSLNLAQYASEVSAQAVQANTFADVSEPDPVAVANAQTLFDRARDLSHLAAQADQLVPLIFLVVVGTVAIYGLGVGRLAEKLGLASSDPQGVLFGGSAPWVPITADLLAREGVQVKIITHEHREFMAAQSKGIPAEFTHVLSDYAADEMDIAGLGFFLAVSSDDSLNASASRQMAHSFGSVSSFQMAAQVSRSPGKRQVSSDWGGRIAFSPATTPQEFDQKLKEGMAVRSTKLTPNFTAEMFQERYGETAVLMFVVQNGNVTVCTDSTELPRTSGRIIALLPPRKPSDSQAAKRKRVVAAAKAKDASGSET